MQQRKLINSEKEFVMRYVILITNILIALIIMTSHQVIAGPPFVTDDPEPVDYQHWEVNYGLNKTWSDGAYSAGLPGIDINYGFTSNLQLHIQPKYTYVHDAGISLNGIDNTEVGIKYRFINNIYTDSTLMVGTYPMIQIPTGENKLSPSSGKAQSFLPIWAQYNQNNWTLYGGTGYRFNNWLDSKNSFFVGCVALYQLTNNFALGGEVFRESAATIGDKSTSAFNLGGTYHITDNYHLLFSAGRGLGNSTSTNSLSTYLALQAIY